MISYILVRREGGPVLYWGHTGHGDWTEDLANARRYGKSSSAQAAHFRLLKRPEVKADSFHVEMIEEKEQ